MKNPLGARDSVFLARGPFTVFAAQDDTSLTRIQNPTVPHRRPGGFVESPAPSRFGVRVGSFELNVRSGELRSDEETTRLSEQPLKILLLLLERPSELVSRDEIRARLWPADTYVDFDTGLNSAVKRLREALGDSAERPRFIETLPRRGYRLIAPVEVLASAADIPVKGAMHRRRIILAAIAAAVLIGGGACRSAIWQTGTSQNPVDRGPADGKPQRGPRRGLFC